MNGESEGVSGKPPPWLLGWRAAKANFLPGMLVPGVMGVVLVLYFWHPPTREFIERMAAVKARWGFGYSALAGILAGAFVPEILRVAVFQKGRGTRRNFENLVFTIPLWCVMGLCVDVLYRMQVVWFGDEATLPVVVAQVFVDQFLYNPLFAAPLLVWLYDWRNGGYRVPKDAFNLRYYMGHVFPTLIAGWAVWIPVTAILYTLPESVQVPLFALALSLWVLIFTWMSENRGGG
jgi:hypothetical protein